MIVVVDSRVFIAVMVFLACFAVTAVKTFAFLNGTPVAMSVYVIAVLLSITLYSMFSVGTAAIKSCLSHQRRSSGKVVQDQTAA